MTEKEINKLEKEFYQTYLGLKFKFGAGAFVTGDKIAPNLNVKANLIHDRLTLMTHFAYLYAKEERGQILFQIPVDVSEKKRIGVLDGLIPNYEMHIKLLQASIDMCKALKKVLQTKTNKRNG